MVLLVEVWAIGPFKKRLIPHYEYSAERYAKTQEGALLAHRLFGIVEGTRLGAEVARGLGISDVWDFNQHKIDIEKIDFPSLQASLAGFERYPRELEALKAFCAEGYDLYFMPNG